LGQSHKNGGVKPVNIYFPKHKSDRVLLIKAIHYLIYSVTTYNTSYWYHNIDIEKVINICGFVHVMRYLYTNVYIMKQYKLPWLNRWYLCNCMSTVLLNVTIHPYVGSYKRLYYDIMHKMNLITKMRRAYYIWYLLSINSFASENPQLSWPSIITTQISNLVYFCTRHVLYNNLHIKRFIDIIFNSKLR